MSGGWVTALEDRKACVSPFLVVLDPGRLTEGYKPSWKNLPSVLIDGATTISARCMSRMV